MCIFVIDIYRPLLPSLHLRPVSYSFVRSVEIEHAETRNTNKKIGFIGPEYVHADFYCIMRSLIIQKTEKSFQKILAERRRSGLRLSQGKVSTPSSRPSRVDSLVESEYAVGTRNISS